MATNDDPELRIEAQATINRTEKVAGGSEAIHEQGTVREAKEYEIAIETTLSEGVEDVAIDLFELALGGVEGALGTAIDKRFPEDAPVDPGRVEILRDGEVAIVLDGPQTAAQAVYLAAARRAHHETAHNHIRQAYSTEGILLAWAHGSGWGYPETDDDDAETVRVEGWSQAASHALWGWVMPQTSGIAEIDESAAPAIAAMASRDRGRGELDDQ